MAYYTVKPRPAKNGTPRYVCTVKAKDKGVLVYNKSRTFSRSDTADAWGKQEVARLEREGIKPKQDTILLRELIDKFLKGGFEFGRTKRFVLELLADCDIGQKVAAELTPNDIVEHCRDRSANAGPATISHDVSYLRWVLRMAPASFGVKTNESIVVDAYPALYAERLIAKSTKRSRRPATKELEKIRAGLIERNKRAIEHGVVNPIPFVDILDFSVLSCMRIGEVCKILWSDLVVEQKAVIVRDRKDPRKKTGNHMLVPLLGGAWDIVMRQPRTEDRVFPYNERSVSAGFQRVRNALEISDLRYHDLRREGASRLFELGFAVHEVAQVTGHRNLNTLWQIYTELYPDSLHEKFQKLKEPKDA
ncbi:MAG TPA: integrase [Rheinheimera sp.]|nr:integrase [Rheinheimera sp.]